MKSVKSSKIPIPIAIIAIIICFSLGIWQLQRAEEKATILETAATLAAKAPTDWAEDMDAPQQYQLLNLNGIYLQDTLLLDNQHHQHAFGYHVITPLQLKSGMVVLVDRGWVNADSIDKTDYKITANTRRQISGQVYYPSDKNMVLGQPFEKKGLGLFLVEKIDMTMIEKILYKEIYPFMLRLAPDEANGYVRDWESALVAMPPSRHYAYALQWFLLALSILIIFIYNVKKKSDS